MATTALKLAEDTLAHLPSSREGNGGSAEEEAGIRVLLADQQAIFRAGLR